ncbi:Uncharacterised protein [BD1-7 clade bacterium]|uniref:STAS/SEC14 domain-containing protein n=1 Tax=BD1-7 clade bacterium TaxID=2029982 RepID=A0A5S9MPL2_9GAMM|nr:Uncharacterised protein [BD1-7 clade bacterium]CAA0085066.1 Uncharacterised protein [BD1-7 clade bacterium]
MIRLLPESHDDILMVQASHKLTAIDYKETFEPALQSRINEYGHIDLMFSFTDDFDGFELGAMWEDAKFGLSHRHNFHKIALVGLPNSMRWLTKAGTSMLDFEVKNFEIGQEKEAESWLTVH